MLLVLCVDLDDDLGRKTGVETPVVGEDAVRDAAVSLATADPEDSDVNVLFGGLHIYEEALEPVTIAAVTGTEGDDVRANRAVGREIDAVLEAFPDSDVRAVVVTDGAQDESVLPVIRSRVVIDGVRRIVVRQAQDLESMYYTMKQVLNDPETRGTVLVPLGVLLLIYPLAILSDWLGLPGAVLGVTSGLLGLYALGRGLGMGASVRESLSSLRESLYAGRVTLVTSVVAVVLVLIGATEGYELLEAGRTSGTVESPLEAFATFTFGAVRWIAVAGITSSLGRITDAYLAEEFQWQHLNAPFYVLAITAVIHAVSGFFVDELGRTALAILLTAGTLLAVFSTLTFAVVQSWQSRYLARA
jgi:putative membrane protein